jgi:hypothetical protein
LPKQRTKHKPRKTLRRKKTGAKRQAALTAPWFALANAPEDPSADLLALAGKCLDAEVMAQLEMMRLESGDQVIATIRNMAVLVCEFLRVLEEVARDKSTAEHPAARQGIEIPIAEMGFMPSLDAIHFAIDANRQILARRIDLTHFFLQILPHLAPENVRICARKRCQRLFYAARKDQCCCTPRCAQLERQADYNQRRKERG